MSFERLERREMLAAGPPVPPGISLSSLGVLNIRGDGRDDTALVTTGSGEINVTLDQTKWVVVGPGSKVPLITRTVKQYDVALVKKISFFGYNGGDVFTNGTSVPSEANGGAGNNTLTGGSGDDHLVGGSGADALEGRGGNDSLEGKSGNDTYVFAGDKLGSDTISEASNLDQDTLDFSDFAATQRASAGNPIRLLSVPLPVTIDLMIGGPQIVNPGNLTLTLGSARTSASGIENVFGGNADDDIYGNLRDNRLFGGGGIDNLRGRGGADWIDGGADNDVISGNEGNDNLHGGPGVDLVMGHEGRDFLFGDDGNDILFGGDQDDSLSGGTGDDLLNGEAGQDKLRGETGADTLNGGPGADMLYGGPEDDLLRGGSGKDSLYGEGGNDSLFGGPQIDTLNGGAGADRFLQQRHLGKKPEDAIADAASADAVVLFADFAGDVAFGWHYSARTWTESEITLADEALVALHRRLGNTKLLKRADGASMPFYRWGHPTSPEPPVPVWPPKPGVGAWNNGDGLNFPDAAFGTEKNWFIQVVQHEIGHNWGNATFSYWTDFLNLSAWQKWEKDKPYDASKYTLVVTGEDPNKQYWLYSNTAAFANSYGRVHPHEDFATAFESYFADYEGRTFLTSDNSAAPVPDKWALLGGLFDSLL